MRAKTTTSNRDLVALGCGLVCLGCGGTDGSVQVTSYGEDFIEKGIPASEVEDGWAVRFERFEVVLTEVQVAGVDLGRKVTLDLTQDSDGEGHPIGDLLAPTGDHGDASFTIERVEVEGSAEKDDETRTFDWVFDEPTHYVECDTTTSVSESEEATFEITVHADHLLYDSLVADEPALRFQELADADLDGDGEITRDELEDSDVGSYDPGSDGDIDDLWRYLEAQVTTLGHVDGEGHCHVADHDHDHEH